MLRIILACLLLGSLAITVRAASPTATVTWIAPTAYADGSAIKNGDLDHYTLSWTGAGNGSVTTKATVNMAIVPVSCGAASFTVTVTTGATAKYPNTTSGPAGPVIFDSKVSCAPNPPSGLAVH